jgi:hypothetical protein
MAFGVKTATVLREASNPIDCNRLPAQSLNETATNRAVVLNQQ